MESLTMFLILILISIITVIALLLAYVFWWFKPPIDRGNFAAIETHILQSLNRAMGHNLANAALVLIQNSEVTATHCLGIANIETQAPVTLDHTLHQLASVSKVVTAWGVMKLVEQGQLSLDEPVQNRLTRWQFPPSEYRDRVTVRHLLSHTAGLDDMFGYNGFLPDETPQTLEESLTLAADPVSGKPRGVRVSREPGKNWLYSGGGYGVLQLLIEEVTQRSFGDYMAEAVLQPLGMTGASFEWEAIVSQGRADDLATNFDAKLKPQPHRRYSVTAAASLYATPQDMVAFAQAYTHPNPVLKPETLAQMMMPQPGAYQDWGLGQILYAANGAGGYVVGHDGNNLPAMSHTVRINPATGNALILMTVGNEGLANQLGDDWVYWETGILSTNARMNHILQILQTGLFGIMGSWFFPSYGQVERETPRW